MCCVCCVCCAGVGALCGMNSPLQVNADIRYYTVHADRTKTLTRVNTTHVGQNISTKAVGSRQVNIITWDYKFREGSSSERAALLGEEDNLLCLFSLPGGLTSLLATVCSGDRV